MKVGTLLYNHWWYNYNVFKSVIKRQWSFIIALPLLFVLAVQNVQTVFYDGMPCPPSQSFVSLRERKRNREKMEDGRMVSEKSAFTLRCACSVTPLRLLLLKSTTRYTLITWCSSFIRNSNERGSVRRDFFRKMQISGKGGRFK